MSMNWINKNHGALMLIAVCIFGVWNIYLTYKTNNREENTITKNADTLTAKLEERVERAQRDIDKSAGTTQLLESKINELDKNLAVIEEKLKNATTKSLMAAGATHKQALQFWEGTSTYVTPQIKPHTQIEVQKLNQ